MEDPIFVVLDVETTGLSAAFGDRICEIGLLRARDETVLETYQTLVNPQRPISPGAARVNGLSDAQVQEAPAFAQIAEWVFACTNQALLVCHNAPFDLGFLEMEFSRLGREWQPAGVIDTLDLARRYFQFSSNSLPFLAAALGIENPQAHRALGDVMTTFQVFRHFYRQLSETRGLTLADLASERRLAPPPLQAIVLPPELHEALAGNQPVIITYVDAQGRETNRMISPVRVQAFSGTVYLVAYCHLRQAERNFRLDRIVSIR